MSDRMRCSHGKPLSEECLACAMMWRIEERKDAQIARLRASHDNVTISLVDSIITLATVLDERLKTERHRLKRSADEHAWHSQPVLDALHDLASNKIVRGLLWSRDDEAMEIIHRAAQSIENEKS